MFYSQELFYICYICIIFITFWLEVYIEVNFIILIFTF